MKLIIQIPCFNEAATIGKTLSSLPRTVEGCSAVEWIIVDDGSTDGTAELARMHGVDHVVRLPVNRGLAKAFMAGIQCGLDRGADIIVNTDADNQYAADCIPDLIIPILDGSAEMVVGARPISSIRHFSPTKRVLQRVGSWAVRMASGTTLPDAPSGFRAFGRRAAEQIMVFGDYTYTIETIVQAGRSGLTVTSVPIRVNPDERPSRLVTSTIGYVLRSVATIVRAHFTYKPLRSFVFLGAALLLAGVAVGVRFMTKYLSGEGAGHVQSLILASILVVTGFQSMLVGVLADLMSANRRLLEDIRVRLIRHAAWGESAPPRRNSNT